MQFNKNFLLGSLVVVVLGLFLAYTGSNNDWFAAKAETTDAQPEQNEEGESPMNSLNKRMGGKETPILVEAEPAQQGVLIQRVLAQGRVHAYKQTDIINEVAGRLESIHFSDGDHVKVGQQLAQIEEREYRLTAEERESAYLKAKATLLANNAPSSSDDGVKSSGEVDLEKLKQQGIISEADYRNEKLRKEMAEILSGSKRSQILSAEYVDQARIELERANLELSKCEIKAPFSGVVFDLSVAQGQWLSTSTKIARIVDLYDVVVRAKVLESEIGRVQVNRPVKINFTALPQIGQIEGTVESISPFVNEEDKTVDTMIRFKNPDGLVRPGMFAEVRIDANRYEEKLMVPKTAILPRDNRKVVFKISEDNRAKWIYVETGVENETHVEITKGEIKPGEMVLTNNHFTMGHDTLVKVSKR